MRFNINEYNKIRYLKTEQINKMSLQELLPIANRAIEFAKNRQDRMLKYMEREGIETTPAMRSPDIQHKQPKSKLGRQEGEFRGFQTYDFELKNNMKENLGYVRYKLNTAIRFLKSGTSTRRGWENLMVDFEKRLTKKFPNLQLDKDFLSKGDKYDMLWRLYRETEKLNPTEISSNLSSNELQKLIYETMEENKGISNFEDLIELVNEKYEDTYTEKLKAESTDQNLGSIRVGTNALKSNKV